MNSNVASYIAIKAAEMGAAGMTVVGAGIYSDSCVFEVYFVVLCGVG